MAAGRFDNLAGSGRGVVLALAVVMLLSGCQSADPLPPATAPLPVDQSAEQAPDEQTNELRGAFWQRGEQGAAERFELARRSTPELIAFLRRMPKGADLHNHLSGAVYADFLIESAIRNERQFDTEKLVFVERAGSNTVTMEAFLARPDLISQFRNQISIRGYLTEGGSGRDHFFQTFDRIGSAGRLPARALAEVLARNAYQNVQYLEVMVNLVPPGLDEVFRSAFDGLDLDRLDQSLAPYHNLINNADVAAEFSRYIDALEKETEKVLRREYGMHFARAPTVRYIPQLNRVSSLERFFISAIFFMTAIQADERVVGLNMVAPEDMPTSRMNFDAQMRILDFLWARIGRPPLSLHAGELSLRESPVEPMQDRIRRAISEGHAWRIGHGVSVAWERDVAGLLEQMAEDAILVEVIPTSAEVILGVKGEDHPFRLYRSAGVPMCISTDDEGVNRSNLTMEYVKMVRQHDLDYADLKEIARDCIRHSFSRLGERREQLVELERRFVRFEQSLVTGFREE